MEDPSRRPLWVHFLWNAGYALVVGAFMVVMGDLHVRWWLLLSAAWGVVGIPITRRWERRDLRDP